MKALKTFRVAVAAAALLALGGCCGTSVPGELTTGEDSIVSTTYGRIQGYNDAGIYTFKGIPYAKAERFMPPQYPDKFEGVEPYYSYEVRSTDIDVGHHMNNTAYIRALLSSFSNEALRAMDVHDIDVVYRTSCYEGETLDFYKKPLDGGGCDIRMARGDQTIRLARMV